MQWKRILNGQSNLSISTINFEHDSIKTFTTI